MEIKIRRLQDAHQREGRQDGKRVFKLVLDSEELVFVIYLEPTERAKKHYQRNILSYQLLFENGINPLRLVYHSNQDLLFLVEHGGKRLDKYLAQCSRREAEDRINQTVQLVTAWNQINLEKQPFLEPRPLQRFLECWQKGAFLGLPRDLRSELAGFQRGITTLMEKIRGNQYLYGYGRVDGTLINFAVKKNRVSTFDFDGTYDFYDLYYILSYLWVSMERVKGQKAWLREYLFSRISFDQKDSGLRFFLGGAGAFSIAMYSQPQNLNVIEGRLKEIAALKKELKL